MKVFRIIPEFRILKLTFQRKSASKSRIKQILLALIYFQFDHLNLKSLIFVGILQVLRFDYKKVRILEILNFLPCVYVVLL